MGILIVERGGGLIKTIEPSDQTFSASNENRSNPKLNLNLNLNPSSVWRSTNRSIHTHSHTHRESVRQAWGRSFLGVTENCRTFNDRQLISMSLSKSDPLGSLTPSPISYSIVVVVVGLTAASSSSSSSASLTFSRFNHQTWRWLPLMVVMMPCSVPCLVACRTCAFIGI